MKGSRLFENLEREDSFVGWIERNPANTDTYENLNQMFKTMRQSEVYSFKRLIMKLQYEILTIGLKNSMNFLQEQLRSGE